MPKPYSILAAALVASGRSLSTETIGAPRGADRMSRPFLGDDWPFCDGTALLTQAREQVLAERPAPGASAADHRGLYSPTL